MNAQAILDKILEDAKENASAVLKDANDRAGAMRKATEERIAAARAKTEVRAREDAQAAAVRMCAWRSWTSANSCSRTSAT